MTKAQKLEIAITALIHALSHIRRTMEFSPANGQACRLLDICLEDISR